VAVTKTFDIEHVRVAVALGLSTVGENYVGELCAKRDATKDLSVTWHYLGAVQTNKIQRIVDCADVICGVSRLRELERIADHRPDQMVYVQVDFTDAVGRNGAAPSDVEALVGRGRALGLDVRGLMTVAPMDLEGARRAFVATGSLADELGLVERSMGMSDDLELACELGSSEVRVGRALFGPRGVDAAP
jgi:uncharacterized pyridoxal phosphate-containing UPF0001 family protein